MILLSEFVLGMASLPEVRTQKFSVFGFGFGWETQHPNPNPKIQKIQNPNPHPNPKIQKIQNPNPNPNPKIQKIQNQNLIQTQNQIFIWEFYNNFLILKQFMLGSLIFKQIKHN
jgi:hypothetical protein